MLRNKLRGLALRTLIGMAIAVIDWLDISDSIIKERATREIPIFGATDDEVRALHPLAKREAERLGGLFDGVKTYCMFIGYPRSGHSLISSLLDAHENAVIAHELNILRFHNAGFNDRQLFAMILENSRRSAAIGRVWGKYSYAVPDQWQGRFKQLTVIGDKKGGMSTQWIGRDVDNLDRLRRTIMLRHRYVHVMRNPFDNIARLFTKGISHIGKATKFYFDNHRTNLTIAEHVGGDNVLHLYHEKFIANPRSELARLCRFLGIDATDDYLRACSDVVSRTPRRPRHMVKWPEKLLEVIRSNIERYDLLRDYSFDD
jgi:hypothetical protein